MQKGQAGEGSAAEDRDEGKRQEATSEDVVSVQERLRQRNLDRVFSRHQPASPDFRSGDLFDGCCRFAPETIWPFRRNRESVSLKGFARESFHIEWGLIIETRHVICSATNQSL